MARGYPETTVADVARRAKVSVDTLYASVGRKPQLLLAVHDMMLSSADEPVVAEQRDYVTAIRAASGARAKLATYAEALGRVFPLTVPLAESLRVAAQTDAECRKVWEGLNERRATNMLLFARDLRATGELREDLTDEDVAHLVWTTNSPEFYRLTDRTRAHPRALRRHGHRPVDPDPARLISEASHLALQNTVRRRNLPQDATPRRCFLARGDASAMSGSGQRVS